MTIIQQAVAVDEGFLFEYIRQPTLYSISVNIRQTNYHSLMHGVLFWHAAVLRTSSRCSEVSAGRVMDMIAAFPPSCSFTQCLL